jgi:hypothetical protein
MQTMTPNTSIRRVSGVAGVLAALSSIGTPAQPRLDVLQARGGLPAHIAASFADPAGYQRLPTGASYVFDRRSHAVYRIEPGQDRAQKIVQVGEEDGRIIQPTAFDMAPNGTFVVADTPNNRERIQVFSPTGARLGGFLLPGIAAARVTIGRVVLNGIGSLQYTGRSILINQPERGTLITEYGLAGTAVRTFGLLRDTGHESDRELHLALNTGAPLADPQGGFYFVFQTGRPMFRKYNAAGEMLFERHIEGPELDPTINALPTEWPARPSAAGTLPVVPATIRTAAVDPDGHLWISLTTPHAYQYDGAGDHIRTVQFRGAGLIAATSLFFPSGQRVLVTPGCYEFDLQRRD